ncbi:hypothetical protein PFISCL1PPCAC_12197 [Pristionchus fissidentatus]|uniref:BHLH domain-containing protein n=1 Tax=Pristionchus fissidentatus TaxID=1538716 RepID=A0AAV5VMV5_9BILA|nr:hypothetical protein PFISCL1PPCAC_12197 [Pristionchus fissidentatus]
MVRSESADEDQMKMDMMDDLDDDCLDVDTVDGADALPGAVRVRAWTDAGGRVMGGSGGSASVSPSNPNGGNVDIDRRIRRQIANCNERRRMQSINAGFQSLRALLPRKEGEKLSKAAILQQTAELIQQLRAERARFLERTGSSEEDTLSGPPSAVWKKPRLERESDSFESIPSSSSSSAASSQNNIAAAAVAQAAAAAAATTSTELVAAATAATQQQQLQQTQQQTQQSMGDVKPGLVDLQNQLERERVMRVYLESKLSTLGSSSSSTPTPLSPIPTFAGFPQLALQNSPLLDSTRLLSDHSPLSTMAAAAALASAAAADAAAAAQQSVIRPTPQQPLQPLRVDVSLANLVSLTTPNVQPPLSTAQPPVATPPSALTHRSLNAILEAIRHLEGVASASSPPPSSHSNLLVR